MTVNEFYIYAKKRIENISSKEKIQSSPLLLIFKILFAMYVSFVITFIFGSIGFRDLPLIIVLFSTFSFSVYLSTIMYRKTLVDSPVRRKAFMLRISYLMNQLNNIVNNTQIYEDYSITARSNINNNDQELKVSYHINFWVNAGGIIAGTPAQMPKKIHDKTFSVLIEGKVANYLKNISVNFDFSARNEDKVPIKITQYKHKHNFLAGKCNIPIQKDKNFMPIEKKLQESITNTYLKGELEIDNGIFQLRIFDNISHFAFNNGKAEFIRFNNSNFKEINDEILSFFGIEKLIAILL